MVDGRWLVLPRHTQPEKDVHAMLDHLQLALPSQPPSRVKATPGRACHPALAVVKTFAQPSPGFNYLDCGIPANCERSASLRSKDATRFWTGVRDALMEHWRKDHPQNQPQGRLFIAYQRLRMTISPTRASSTNTNFNRLTNLDISEHKKSPGNPQGPPRQAHHPALWG